jgi:hypothetical protein
MSRQLTKSKNPSQNQKTTKKIIRKFIRKLRNQKQMILENHPLRITPDDFFDKNRRNSSAEDETPQHLLEKHMISV